jgi:hypothetical protein
MSPLQIFRQAPRCFRDNFQAARDGIDRADIFLERIAVKASNEPRREVYVVQKYLGVQCLQT